MSLISPHKSAYGNIASTNLSSVLNSTKKEDLVTGVAEKAFEDYQKNTFGLGHHVKKFALSTACGAVVIGTPVTAVLGGTYWLLKDYIHDPSLLIKNPPIPTVKDAAYVAGAVAVDTFFYKAFGVAPIKTAIGWSIGMISMGIINAANLAQNMMAGSFVQKEKAMIKTREEMHQLVVTDLKTTYDHMAEGFSQLLDSAKDSPKELLKLKGLAEEIEEKMPYVREQLAKFDIKTAESHAILNQLSSVATHAQKFAFGLRFPQNLADVRFNVELMSILSEEECAAKAVSTEVQMHIKAAKAHTLGVMHTLKSIGKASLKGSALALATGLFIPTIFAAGVFVSKNSSCLVTRSFEACALESKAALASIPVALIAGGFKVKQVLNRCFAERKRMDQKKVENTKDAFKKMSVIYTGMADYLMEGLRRNTNSYQLKQDAKNILDKLPAIKEAIANSGLENHEEITAPLEHVLQDILSGRNARRA